MPRIMRTMPKYDDFSRSGLPLASFTIHEEPWDPDFDGMAEILAARFGGTITVSSTVRPKTKTILMQSPQDPRLRAGWNSISVSDIYEALTGEQLRIVRITLSTGHRVYNLDANWKLTRKDVAALREHGLQTKRHLRIKGPYLYLLVMDLSNPLIDRRYIARALKAHLNAPTG